MTFLYLLWDVGVKIVWYGAIFCVAVLAFIAVAVAVGCTMSYLHPDSRRRRAQEKLKRKADHPHISNDEVGVLYNRTSIIQIEALDLLRRISGKPYFGRLQSEDDEPSIATEEHYQKWSSEHREALSRKTPREQLLLIWKELQLLRSVLIGAQCGAEFGTAQVFEMMEKLLDEPLSDSGIAIGALRGEIENAMERADDLITEIRTPIEPDWDGPAPQMPKSRALGWR